MRIIISYIKENYKIYKKLLKNDFRARYTGSYLGVIWGFIQPIITILIYWLVFQFGLRSSSRPDGTPYIIWMIAGMIPWFFFSDAIGSVTNTFLDYSYMVKKLKFRISLLPLVKIGSSFIVHFIFILFSTVIFNFYGYTANWYYLQLVYYLAALLYLILGIGLLTSSLSVYLRDTGQIVGIFIQIGFWAIPIVWGPEVLHGMTEIILKLNPVYYIVQGYRETLLSGEGFWGHPVYALYYWGISTLIFILGLYTFRKLKINFADVL